jgi:hypothetical protein
MLTRMTALQSIDCTPSYQDPSEFFWLNFLAVGAGAKLDRDGSKLDSGDGSKLDFWQRAM